MGYDRIRYESMAGSEVTGLLSIVITPNFKEDSVKVRRL